MPVNAKNKLENCGEAIAEIRPFYLELAARTSSARMRGLPWRSRLYIRAEPSGATLIVQMLVSDPGNTTWVCGLELKDWAVDVPASTEGPPYIVTASGCPSA